jgi:uncharacterized protein YlzI (FlbEa/FlbD family)
MFIEVTKTFDEMDERKFSYQTLLNINHIVCIDATKRECMITLTDGTFITVKESLTTLIARINYAKTQSNGRY